MALEDEGFFSETGYGGYRLVGQLKNENVDLNDLGFWRLTIRARNNHLRAS